MHARHPVAGVLAAAIVVPAACGGTAAPDPDLPAIVAQSIAYHGGDLYERSKITMTITSLSGSFDIEATRDGGTFESHGHEPGARGPAGAPRATQQRRRHGVAPTGWNPRSTPRASSAPARSSTPASSSPCCRTR